MAASCEPIFCNKAMVQSRTAKLTAAPTQHCAARKETLGWESSSTTSSGKALFSDQPACQSRKGNLLGTKLISASTRTSQLHERPAHIIPQKPTAHVQVVYLGGVSRYRATKLLNLIVFKRCQQHRLTEQPIHCRCQGVGRPCTKPLLEATQEVRVPWRVCRPWVCLIFGLAEVGLTRC